MKKKSIILCSLVAICAIGLITSLYVDWPVDFSKSDGDIAKAAKFSREEVSKDLSNMEELLKTDSAFKDGIVVAQVVMQTRTVQFGTLVNLSNEVAGNIPDNLNAALSGEECPDLAQSTINASLAYMTLQKQNNLATRFIETTDKYLETAQGDDKLKLVRDQWLEYQKTTAAIEGDKASAEALAKKSYLLSGEKALAAVENLDLNAKVALLQSCEMAQRIKVPSQIRSDISSKALEKAQKLFSVQDDVLSAKPPKKEKYNAMIGSASRVMAAYSNALNNVVNNPALNQSQNIGLDQTIGYIIKQTAALNNSEMLNKKKPNGPPKEK